MKKLLKNTVVDAILLLILGIVLLVNPGGTLETLFRIIGVMLIIMGAVRIISFFVKKEKKDHSVPALIIGIIQALIGLILIEKPNLLISVWYKVAAVLIAYGAIVSLIRAVRQMKEKSSAAVATLILSIITLILAIVVFANPIALAAFYTQLIGVSFILDGITLALASLSKSES